MEGVNGKSHKPINVTAGLDPGVEAGNASVGDEVEAHFDC
jgi:hypothetical protein